MKKYLIVLMFALLGSNVVKAQYFPIDTVKFNSTFRTLMSDKKDVQYQQDFFNAFPDTWRQFIMTYQYYPDNYNLCMYSLASSHILKGLKNLPAIDDCTYCNKLIHLTIGGVMEVDAPNYLNSLLHKVMWNKMDVMLTKLSELRKGDQMLFWEYYWSSRFKNKKSVTEFDKMVKKNTATYPEVMKTMKIAYQYFSKDRY